MTLITVEDKDGKRYSMPSKRPRCILEVHYSTSYLQFVVQDHYTDENGNETFPEKDVIVPLEGSNGVDFIAVNENEIGRIIT